MNSEDLAIIRSDGVPVEPDSRFVLVGPDGRVRFTDRGRQLYRVSMLMYGLAPDPVDNVRTLSDLREVSLKIKGARLILLSDETEREAHSGRIPARSREIVNAILYGTPEDLHAAVEHRLSCAAAGENVIPFASRPR